MPKLYSGQKVVKILERAGFWQVSQRGSHIKLKGIRHGKLRTVIVPNHKEIALGTFRSILSQAEMTIGEIESFEK